MFKFASDVNVDQTDRDRAHAEDARRPNPRRRAPVDRSVVVPFVFTRLTRMELAMPPKLSHGYRA